MINIAHYWEDRIRLDQYNRCSDAIQKFRKTSKNYDAQLRLYMVLEDNGVWPEEADEIVNLEMQD